MSAISTNLPVREATYEDKCDHVESILQYRGIDFTGRGKDEEKRSKSLKELTALTLPEEERRKGRREAEARARELTLENILISE